MAGHGQLCLFYINLDGVGGLRGARSVCIQGMRGCRVVSGACWRGGGGRDCEFGGFWGVWA